MSHKGTFVLVFVLLVTVLSGVIVEAQGPQPGSRVPRNGLNTGFTYQGQLKNGGAVVNGTCDFQFGLWNSASLGSQIGATVTVPSVIVMNGLFTTLVDFGTSAFNGDARYLGIAVACPSGVSYTAFGSRQALTPAPMAFALPGLYTQQNGTSANVIGGYSGNLVTPGVYGATIGGGGDAFGAHRVTDNYGTIGGGYNNRAGDNVGTTGDKTNATVSGGFGNVASGSYSTVGGGNVNTASNSAATIGGGDSNTASASYTTVSGGYSNTASFLGTTVSGGSSNIASKNYAAVGGGDHNSATGVGATIGGGESNNANGDFATVPGGYQNTAAMPYSFAAGRGAVANHQGSFVWADSYSTPITSTTANQFVIRATNGVSLTKDAGGAKSVAVGERYRDNAIIAWGDVLSDGTVSGAFGIASVLKSTGTYTVTLTAVPSGMYTIVPVAIPEIDSPPTSAASARIISINIIGANQFIVYTTDGNYALVDQQFLFMATGR